MAPRLMHKISSMLKPRSARQATSAPGDTTSELSTESTVDPTTDPTTTPAVPPVRPKLDKFQTTLSFLDMEDDPEEEARARRRMESKDLKRAMSMVALGVPSRPSTNAPQTHTRQTRSLDDTMPFPYPRSAPDSDRPATPLTSAEETQPDEHPADDESVVGDAHSPATPPNIDKALPPVPPACAGRAGRRRSHTTGNRVRWAEDAREPARAPMPALVAPVARPALARGYIEPEARYSGAGAPSHFVAGTQPVLPVLRPFSPLTDPFASVAAASACVPDGGEAADADADLRERPFSVFSLSEFPTPPVSVLQAACAPVPCGDALDEDVLDDADHADAASVVSNETSVYEDAREEWRRSVYMPKQDFLFTEEDAYASDEGSTLTGHEEEMVTNKAYGADLASEDDEVVEY